MEAGNQAKPSQPDRDGPHGLFSPIRRRHGGRPGVFGSRGRVRLPVCPVFDTGVAGVVFSHSIVVFSPIKSFFSNNIMYSIIYFPFHAKGRCHQYEMAQQRQAAVGKMLPYL
jgi:hypothetical protein